LTFTQGTLLLPNCSVVLYVLCSVLRATRTWMTSGKSGSNIYQLWLSTLVFARPFVHVPGRETEVEGATARRTLRTDSFVSAFLSCAYSLNALWRTAVSKHGYPQPRTIYSSGRGLYAAGFVGGISLSGQNRGSRCSREPRKRQSPVKIWSVNCFRSWSVVLLS
jgi:hypothetical protein